MFRIGLLFFCKALQHKFDVVGVQLHKPATHYLGRAVIPGNPLHLSLGRTGIHQQINNLVDNILIIWQSRRRSSTSKD